MKPMTKKEIREWKKQHPPKFGPGDNVQKVAFINAVDGTRQEVITNLTVSDVLLVGDYWPFWRVTAIGRAGKAWYQASESFFQREGA